MDFAPTTVGELEELSEGSGVTQGKMVRIVVGVFLYSVVFVTIVGNAMVLAAVWRNKRLQTVFNLYIVNLAFTDILVALTAMSFYTTDNLLGYWPFGRFMCGVWIFFDYGMTFASVFTLLAISVDRLWAARWSLHYRTHKTWTKTVLGIALVWLVVLTLWLPGCITDRLRHGQDGVCIWEPSNNREYVIVVAVVGHHGSCLTILASYVSVLCLLRKRAKVGIMAVMVDRNPTQSQTKGVAGGETAVTSVNEYSVSVVIPDLSVRGSKSSGKGSERAGPVLGAGEMGINQSRADAQRLNGLPEKKQSTETSMTSIPTKLGTSFRLESAAEAIEIPGSPSSDCYQNGSVSLFSQSRSLAVLETNRLNSSKLADEVLNYSTNEKKPLEINKTSDGNYKINRYPSEQKGNVSINKSPGLISGLSVTETSGSIHTASGIVSSEPQVVGPWQIPVEQSSSSVKSSSSLGHDHNAGSTDLNQPVPGDSMASPGPRVSKTIADSRRTRFLDPCASPPGSKVRRHNRQQVLRLDSDEKDSSGGGDSEDDRKETPHGQPPPTDVVLNVITPQSSGRLTSSGGRVSATGKSPKSFGSKEMRAFVTLTYVVITYVICWVPFHIVFDVRSAWPELVPELVYTVTFWMCYFNSAVNPILYNFSSRDFRRAFKEMVCRK